MVRHIVIAIIIAGVSGCVDPGIYFPQPYATPEETSPSPQETARQQQVWAAQERAQAAWQAVIQKAESHGYRLITNFNDLVLDGKQLAGTNAKVMLTTFYRKVGEIEYIYPTQYDAYQGSNGFPILTEDAQRPLREYFMSVECAQSPMGCRASVGGHVTTCQHLNPLFANYPPEPCLNVEVVIQ